LGDEDHRLLDNGIDEQMGVQVFSVTPVGEAQRLSRVTATPDQYKNLPRCAP